MGVESLIVSASATGGVTAAAISNTTETFKVGSGCLDSGGGGVGGCGWVLMMTTEAVAKSAVTLYANFIHFVFNELISV